MLYAAGAGLGDAPGQPNRVDHDAILAFADATRTAGVRRFVMLSAMGASPTRSCPADPLVARSPLDCTVVRPAWFREGPGTGRVHLAATTGRARSTGPTPPPSSPPC
ncbi:NAD(P)H-binding protein [Kitasatospora sp. NPDC001095]